MKQNRDAGTSSAAAFLMILAVILVCAGVFAAAVLPAEEKRKAEQQADAAKTTLSETVFLMRGAAESAETRGLEFSVLLPKGTLTAESHGYLQIEGRSIPLCSVCLEAGKTTQGISAGGIWRKDGEDFAWILYPKTAYENGVLIMELFTLSGNPAYGSTAGIPFSFCSTGYRTQTVSKNPVTLTVISEDSGVRNLWKTFFRETGFLYADTIQTKITTKPDRVSAEYSVKTGSLSLEVREASFTISAGEL